VIRVGLGFDAHPFVPAAGGRPLVLGGVRIEGPPLGGHSDADAVCHAVADALLGAAGLGDLGSRHPADDPALAGASSLRLLEEVAAAVAAAGWRVGNVDVVVAAERPRLGPHVPAMQARLAQALAAAVGGDAAVPVRVSPKRTEGLGFVGRAEGIAVWAVALLEAP
jgi:2-C-methyl-D-erythritol 2,4-cyclodiphosphate synthase